MLGCLLAYWHKKRRSWHAFGMLAQMTRMARSLANSFQSYQDSNPCRTTFLLKSAPGMPCITNFQFIKNTRKINLLVVQLLQKSRSKNKKHYKHMKTLSHKNKSKIQKPQLTWTSHFEVIMQIQLLLPFFNFGLLLLSSFGHCIKTVIFHRFKGSF